MRSADFSIESVDFKRGNIPERAKVSNIVSAEYIQELLYRTEDVTDDMFLELVDDIGRRAAWLVLRAKAVNGDVRALDLYLRLSKEAKSERERKSVPLDRVIGESFTPVARE